MSKKLTIEDLLNSLQVPNKEDKLSPKQLWEMIANGESLEQMGFMDEKEKKNWIIANPYGEL